MTITHASMIEIDALGATVHGLPDPEDFCDEITRLLDNEEQAHWCVPDMLLWAETSGDERYAQALDPTKLNPRTLANRMTICRKFPKETRRWKLSQRHYAQLTSLMPEHRELAFELLATAARTGMTSEELLAAKKERLNEPTPETFLVTLVYYDGVFVPTVQPPTWVVDKSQYTVTLRSAA